MAAILSGGEYEANASIKFRKKKIIVEQRRKK